MQYIWVLPNGIVFMQLIVVLMYEILGEKNKRDFLKFRSPLYYSINKKSVFDIIIFDFLRAYLFIFLVFFLYQIDEKYIQNIESFLKNINGVGAILLSYGGVVISVIIFSATFGKKEYYLSVTREEINKRYYIDKVYMILGAAIAGSVICSVLMQDESIDSQIELLTFVIYQICCISIIVVGIYALIMIGRLTIGDSKMELKSLNKLYKIFWNNSALKLVNQTEVVIEINLAYLLGQYEKLYLIRPGNIENVVEIQYQPYIVEEKKWRKVALKKMTVGLLFITAVVDAIYILQKDYGWALASLLFFGCLKLMFMKETTNVCGKFVTAIIVGNSGFLVKLRKNEKFIGNGIICNIPGKKYVLNIENMMALYCILCSGWEEKTGKYISRSYIQMIEFLRGIEKERQGYSKAIFYLPVFACSYYFYIYFPKKNFPKEIIDLFQSFDLDEDEKKRYLITLNSFISSASRFRLSEADWKNHRKENWSDVNYEKYIENNGYWKLISKIRS